MNPRTLALLCLAAVATTVIATPLAVAMHPYNDSGAPDKCVNKNEVAPDPTDPAGTGGYDCSPAIWTDCLTGGVCKVCQYDQYSYDHKEMPPGSGFYVPNDSHYESGCVTI